MAYQDLNNVHNPSPGGIAPAGWGDQVRDNDEWFATAKPMIRVTRSVDQTIPTGQLTAIAFTSERWKTVASMHDINVLNTRVSAPVAGIYHAGTCTQWQNNAAGVGSRTTQIRKNGTNPVATSSWPAVSAANHQTTISTDVELAAGDYLEVVVFHSAGADLTTMKVADYAPDFWVRWVGFA